MNRQCIGTKLDKGRRWRGRRNVWIAAQTLLLLSAMCLTVTGWVQCSPIEVFVLALVLCGLSALSGLAARIYVRRLNGLYKELLAEYSLHEGDEEQ